MKSGNNQSATVMSSSPSFFKLLRHTEVPTDFVLEASNGVRFPCFKLLLSVRSRPLAAMISNWKEGKEGKMRLEEDEATVKVQRSSCV